ncbi:hypothetical protein H2198_000162 [Neophaeococcomyces mojaviensis]|uniref:Uncharacterized protein n=1 Tax=Neophaeococcomyces mojaviensis TaxID=3383035 RepID=A0ACC3AL37_9EURO|nr:hypothetical protein H2198_000162 [Knufia sp. JES_112]
MAEYSITPAEWDHFSSNPWAKSLLTAASQGNSEYVPVPTKRRQSKPTDEDGFLSGTLNTAKTLPFFITLRRRELSSVTAGLPRTPPATALEYEKKPFTPERPPDTITLVSLGTPGVSGLLGTAHGGLLATLFDETMALARASHKSESDTAVGPSAGSLGATRVFTAQLTIRYRKPVRAAAVLVIHSWCIARDGHKIWTVAQAVQEDEDASGHLEWSKGKTVKADASALWVVAGAKL